MTGWERFGAGLAAALVGSSCVACGGGSRPTSRPTARVTTTTSASPQLDEADDALRQARDALSGADPTQGKNEEGTTP